MSYTLIFNLIVGIRFRGTRFGFDDDVTDSEANEPQECGK